jgi:D-serine deaminase-like pyridoxal phosphate-dependent protein
MLNINKPTLVIDKAICMSNIQYMVEKAQKHHLKFRPHFKTHQSATIGNWFRDAGVEIHYCFIRVYGKIFCPKRVG